MSFNLQKSNQFCAEYEKCSFIIQEYCENLYSQCLVCSPDFPLPTRRTRRGSRSLSLPAHVALALHAALFSLGVHGLRLVQRAVGATAGVAVFVRQWRARSTAAAAASRSSSSSSSGRHRSGSEANAWGRAEAEARAADVARLRAVLGRK
jgi:hypothetical protein